MPNLSDDFLKAFFDEHKGQGPKRGREGVKMKKCWFIPLIIFLILLISAPVFAQPNMSGVKFRDSLRGLDGLGIVVGVSPGTGLTEDQVRTDVELKLRLAGIKVVTSKESMGLPGSPFLYVQATPFTTGLELNQWVYLTRDSKIKILAGTWSKYSPIFEAWVKSPREHSDDEIARWVRKELSEILDVFLNDYLSVNPKR